MKKVPKWDWFWNPSRSAICCTERDVEVFIDVAEKVLGAKKGSMEFLRELIE